AAIAAAVKGTALTTSTLTLVKGTLKIMAWTKLKIAVGVGVATLVAVQWQQIASQRKQLAVLQVQQEIRNAKAPKTEPAQMGSPELDQLRAGKVRLSNEVNQLRGQLVAQHSVEAQPLRIESKLNASPPSEPPMRELGLAVAQGDPTALGKLEALSKAAHETFNTNGARLKTDEERGRLQTEAFSPVKEAFDVLGEEAGKGNTNALQALARATQMQYLRGFALQSLGEVAGQGNESVLEALLNPDKYGLLLSGTVSALKPAADNGNQKAIDALAAVTTDDNNRALWFLAAEGLEKAAGAGNSAAIDALIGLSGSTDRNVQAAAIRGLQRASENQNAKAADALRQLGIE
ncbi:MAG: polymerase, sigma-24 subunit, subfamily, partial [Pedosphaera sp.]|nr:polymerase, sigma-24 subunit, subfamily [Pedosphaera sp.]